MTTTSLVGIRVNRNGPVILADVPDGIVVARGDPVLVELETGLTLASVALAPDEIAWVTPAASPVRVRAVGAASPEVTRVIELGDAVALDAARRLAGPGVPIAGATWSPDHARLTVTFADGPPPVAEDLRDRLAAHFRAEIRLHWRVAAGAAPAESPREREESAESR